MRVNIVSQVPADIWLRELPTLGSMEMIHSDVPIPADVHVIYGLRTKMLVPNTAANTIFVASEPPEIRRYNLQVLSKYRAVLGPGYSYLEDLPNYWKVSAICPWWVGSRAGGEQHYDPKRMRISLSRKSLVAGFEPVNDILSVIVSSKTRTPMQQQRLRLVEYLLHRIPSMEVFGFNYKELLDKKDALINSRYHLAVENSCHAGYWTEKLADPILMNNVVFYAGDPTIHRSFDSGSVIRVNPYDQEGTYREIASRMSEERWERSKPARLGNRTLLLENLSFHRTLERFLKDNTFAPNNGNLFHIPAQNPANRFKKSFDPIYRQLIRGVGHRPVGKG